MIMDSEREQLIKIVVAEASERLATLDDLFLELEVAPNQRELIDQVMRTAHTLKGTVGIAGFGDLAELAHTMESAVLGMRDGRVLPSPELFDRLGQAIEVLRKETQGLSACVSEHPRAQQVTREFETWLGEHAVTGPNPARAEVAPDHGLQLGEYDRLRIGVLEKQGKRLYLGRLSPAPDINEPAEWAAELLRSLRGTTTVVATEPGLGELARVGECGALTVLFASTSEHAELLELLRSVSPGGARLARYTERAVAVATAEREVTASDVAAERTVRVDLALLDDLMRLVGEVTLGRDRLLCLASDCSAQLGDEPLAKGVAEAANRIGALGFELQEAVLSARMVPIARLFRQLARAARIAKSGGRRAAVQTLGGDLTELDKRVVDALDGPLCAVIASAVAASAELPQITIQAERRHDHVHVIVRFLGCSPDDQAAETLILALGRVAGRLEREERVRGEVTLRLVLPPTRAIVRVMMVEVGDERYAIPLEAVRETLRLGPSAISTIDGANVIELRDCPLSLLSLREALGVPGVGAEVEQRAIVLDHPNHPLAVVVDRVLGIREVVLKGLGQRLAGVPLIGGSAVLGDQEIALFLKPAALIDRAVAAAAGAKLPVRRRAAPEEVIVCPG